MRRLTCILALFCAVLCGAANSAWAQPFEVTGVEVISASSRDVSATGVEYDVDIDSGTGLFLSHSFDVFFPPDYDVAAAAVVSVRNTGGAGGTQSFSFNVSGQIITVTNNQPSFDPWGNRPYRVWIEGVTNPTVAGAYVIEASGAGNTAPATFSLQIDSPPAPTNAQISGAGVDLNVIFNENIEAASGVINQEFIDQFSTDLGISFQIAETNFSPARLKLRVEDGSSVKASDGDFHLTYTPGNNPLRGGGGGLEVSGFTITVTNNVPPVVTQAVTNLDGTQILVGFNAPIESEGLTFLSSFLDQFDVSIVGAQIQSPALIVNNATLSFFVLFLSVDPAFTPADGDFDLTYTPGGNRLRREGGGPEVEPFTVTVENLVRTFSSVNADDVVEANTPVDIELTIKGSLLGGQSIAIEGMDALHPWVAGGDLATADFSAITTSGAIDDWEYDAGTGVLTVEADSVMSNGAVITVTISLTGGKTWGSAPGADIEETLTATRSDAPATSDVTFTITNLVPPKPIEAETNGTGIEVYVQFDSLIDSEATIDAAFLAQFDTGAAGIHFLVAGTQISGSVLVLAVDGAVTPADGDFELTYTPLGNRLLRAADGLEVEPFSITVENKVATLDPITVNTVLDSNTTIDIELTVKHFFSFMFTIEGVDALHPWIAGGVLESADFILDVTGDVDYDAGTGVLSIESEYVFDEDSLTVTIDLTGGKTWVAAPSAIIEETLIAARETTPSGDAPFTITNAIPGIVSAQTNNTGDEARVTFNQPMADIALIGSGGFSLSHGGDVTAVHRYPGDDATLILSLQGRITAADIVTVSYDGAVAPDILSASDGVLASFTTQPVTNLVPGALELIQTPGGTISTVPAGITSFASSDSVILAATPDVGYGFEAWSLAPGSVGEIIGNTFHGGIGDATIEAEFILLPWILVLEQALGGVISTVPAGIVSFVSGASVELSATPDPGYAFVGWSIRPGFEGEIIGDVFIGAPSNAVIDAEFAPIGWSLDLLSADGGTISTVPAGITSFVSNTEVVLAATPDAGYSFMGWSLAPGSVGEIIGNTFHGGIGDATIEAEFDLTPWALELAPTTGGAISTAPAGITSFVSGETVVLSATPDAGYSFTGWSLTPDSVGEIVGNTFFGGIGDATLSAEFILAPWTLELIQTQGGVISTVPAGVTAFASGAEVVLSATPNAGWVFVSWILSADSSGEVVGDSYFGGIGDATLEAEFFELPKAARVAVIASMPSVPVGAANGFTLILLDQYGAPLIATGAMVFEIQVELTGPGDPTLGVSTFGGAAMQVGVNAAHVTIEAGTTESIFTFANSWAGSYTLTAHFSHASPI